MGRDPSAQLRGTTPYTRSNVVPGLSPSLSSSNVARLRGLRLAPSDTATEVGGPCGQLAVRYPEAGRAAGCAG
jgi:hypothetical protein